MKIAITQGDTNGIGLELVLKAFSNPEMFELCTPILYANEKTLQQHRKTLGMPGVQYRLVNSPEHAEPGCLNLVPVTVQGVEISVNFGKAEETAGRMALAAIEAADVKAISHITGGGFYENIPRMMKKGLTAKVDRSAVPVLPIFDLIAKTGNIPERDMFNTFNMGVGMCMAVSKETADAAIKALNDAGEKAFVIGEVVEGDEGVILC